MGSSSRSGCSTSTSQNKGKEAIRKVTKRSEPNLSSSASIVSKESTDSTAEKVGTQTQAQKLQEPEQHISTIDHPPRRIASPINDRDLDDALLSYVEEEEVPIVAESSSAAPLASLVAEISTQPEHQVAQTRWESVTEIDEEGNTNHLCEKPATTSSTPHAKDAKAAARGKAGDGNAAARSRARVRDQRGQRKAAEKELHTVKTETQPPKPPNILPTTSNNATLPESVDLTLSPSPLPEAEVDEARLRMPPPSTLVLEKGSGHPLTTIQ